MRSRRRCRPRDGQDGRRARPRLETVRLLVHALALSPGEAALAKRYPDDLASYFTVEEPPEEVLPPSYNVATTDPVYVVLERMARLGGIASGRTRMKRA